MSEVLREVVNTMQVRGEPRRRWFASASFDLIVWLDESGVLIGFQLCYGKPTSENALTWRIGENSLAHMAVDDGEAGGGGRYKSTPILKPGGAWDAGKILRDFLGAAVLLPSEIKALVIDQLELATRANLGMTFDSRATPGRTGQ